MFDEERVAGGARTQPDREAESVETTNCSVPGGQLNQRSVAPIGDELKSSNKASSVESLNHKAV